MTSPAATQAKVSMMRSFCEQVHNPIIISGLDHLVVNDNHVAYVVINIGVLFQVFRDTMFGTVFNNSLYAGCHCEKHQIILSGGGSITF